MSSHVLAASIEDVTTIASEAYYEARLAKASAVEAQERIQAVEEDIENMEECC